MATPSGMLEYFRNLKLEDVQACIRATQEDIASHQRDLEFLQSLERMVKARDGGEPLLVPRSVVTPDPVPVESPAALMPDYATTPITPVPRAAIAATNGEPELQRPAGHPRLGRQASAETVALRNRLTQYLRVHGPMTVPDLSKRLDVEYSKLQNALYGKQFKRVEGTNTWTVLVDVK